MSDSNATSYDLLQAQQILTLLKKNPCLISKERDSEEATSPYSKLSRLAPPKQAEPCRTTDTAELILPAEPKSEDIPQTFTSWENCITWCMTLTRAEAAFVVDSQGFIIACRGRIPSQGYEGAGAELICSIEQLERIAPDAGRLSCIDLEFDKKRLVGFVAASDETALYIVGLMEPEVLSSTAKHKVLNQIINNLPTMD
jgi:hypothetical protein